MGSSCEGGNISQQDIARIFKLMNETIDFPLRCIGEAVTLIGLCIVFIYFKQYSKPRFVKVTWAMLTLMAVCSMLQWVFRHESVKTDGDRATKFKNISVWFAYIMNSLSQMVHWQFVA